MTFQIVIPARLESSRLPRKVLADIHGKPMLWHVWQKSLLCTQNPENIWIAADDMAIIDALCNANLPKKQLQITKKSHASGTDRIAELAERLAWDDNAVVVNVQGDEPHIPPECINQVANLLLNNPKFDMATLATPIHEYAEWINPNAVKVVLNHANQALYFSRSPIPFDRNIPSNQEKLPQIPVYRHIGIYAYRVKTLKTLVSLSPAPLEQCESLEQLRALANRIDIQVGILDNPPPAGVDTAEDLARARAFIP